MSEARFWQWANGLVGITLFIGGVGLLGYQCFFWLRYGEWLHVDNLMIWHWLSLPPPKLRWAGIEKILIWILDCQANLTGMIAGGILLQSRIIIQK